MPRENSARTCKQDLQVRQEGGRSVTRWTRLYNLKAILAVGFRVRSPRGAQFRRWATETLNDYLVKGFVMNDERLKEPGGWDYFDELLERIRDIRASEKHFYQKLRELFAETSADYDAKSDTAKSFFATIQNKLLYAVTGSTAAELIVARADPERPMALTSWKGQYPKLSDRRNVIVIADEAHRTQYGLKATVNTKTGVISYSFAKYLRDALPNASFIGFTGTPINAEDVNMRAVFGDYICALCSSGCRKKTPSPWSPTGFAG